MRQARQLAPVSGVPQEGQASNSASGARRLIRASCRIAAAVVTATAADYHLRMKGTGAMQVDRFYRQAGPDHRIWLRSENGDRVQHLALSGFMGPAIPDPITHPSLDRRGDSSGRGWRLSCDQGKFDFQALAVDRIETRPALYATLHVPFGLSVIDRVSVRLLLALLRLPGGARLLRRWHARRSE